MICENIGLSESSGEHATRIFACALLIATLMSLFGIISHQEWMGGIYRIKDDDSHLTTLCSGAPYSP